MAAMSRWLGIVLAAGALATPAAAQNQVRVVASFSIMADLVQQVGRERVTVSSLVRPNVDIHTFQPSPSDSRRLAEAQLVVINGLGLEGWADRLVKPAAGRLERHQGIAGRSARPLRPARLAGGR